MKNKKKTSIGLTLLFVTILAVGVYSGLDTDGMSEDEVYKLTDIAMDVQVDSGYSGRVLTASPELIIHGDKRKVKKLKKAGTVPEVKINMKRKKPGEYEAVPSVEGKLFQVNYTFKPEKVAVAVLEARELKYLVLEREFGLVGEGMHVTSVMADEEAVLSVTEEQDRRIGNIIAEVDVEGMKESGDARAVIHVLDKRGDFMEDVEKMTKDISVFVTLEKLGWLQTKEDITALEKEIEKYRVELEEKKAQDVGEMDVLKRADLVKEIDFREKRIAKKSLELKEKKSGFAEMKKAQEDKKLKEVNKSIVDGGKVEEKKKDEDKEDIEETIEK